MFDDAGLVRDHLLRPQREPHRVLGRQRERLVEGVRVQRLRPAEHCRERLDRRPDQVHLRLLRGQRDAGGLRVEAHQPRARILRAVLVAHLPRPDPARCAVLRDLLEEVEVRVEEEGEPRRERVDVEPALEARLHEREAVGEREGELLRGVRAGLADVVPGDRDRVHERQPLRAPLDHVHDEPHRRRGREDPLLLRDVLLEDVRLDGAAQPIERDALLLADARVEREQHRGRAVDRHRRRDLAERDPVEERLHVGERVDRHALAPDLAERARVVGVVAHQRRHVERRREAGLPVLEQVAEARVRLLRRAEAGELAHRPEPAAVHRRIDAARERIRAGPAEVALVVDVDVLGRVERLVLDAGDRREELALALRRRLVALAPLPGAARLLLAVGRRHSLGSLEPRDAQPSWGPQTAPSCREAVGWRLLIAPALAPLLLGS